MLPVELGRRRSDTSGEFYKNSHALPLSVQVDTLPMGGGFRLVIGGQLVGRVSHATNVFVVDQIDAVCAKATMRGSCVAS